jgi:hypothetical protein
MPTVTCKRVRLYSQADEAAFFHFVKSIKAVKRIEGVNDSIVLHISSRPSQASLRDLAALFRRYRIAGSAQLAPLANPIRLRQQAVLGKTEREMRDRKPS